MQQQQRHQTQRNGPAYLHEHCAPDIGQQGDNVPNAVDLHHLPEQGPNQQQQFQ